MTRGINKVILVGTLGTDPIHKTLTNGNNSTTVSVATNEQWKDKTSGQLQQKTEWHRVVIFGKLAEIAEKILQTGSLVFFEGKQQSRKWTDDKGEVKYITETIVDSMNGHMQILSNGIKPAESGFKTSDDSTSNEPKNSEISGPIIPKLKLDENIPF